MVSKKKNTFFDRMDELEKRVGGPDPAKTQVIFSQQYAADQNVKDRYNHPRGGQAHYVEVPLMAEYKFYLEKIARHILRGRIQEALHESGVDWSEKSIKLAPRERGILKKSADVRTYDGETITHRKPPAMPYQPDSVVDNRSTG